MTHAKNIVERYLEAFYGGDDQAVRPYLADDVSFAGPAATFSTAEMYLRATAHVRRAARGVEKRKVFAEGPDVCIFYDLLIDNPVGSVPIAEWYHLDGEKIAAIRTILDTAPFTIPTTKERGETAVDQVCQMTASKASAAATQNYAGSTYYFCGVGCAKVFENEPETYLGASRR